MKKSFVGILFLLLTLNVFSQSNEVLFSIDDTPFYTKEFTRVYKKNLDLVKDDSQKDLDAYLDLFIGYKLKVQKALKLGLDQEEKYKKELASYRKQLSKKYLNDSKVTEKLIQEAYDRIQEEVRASHILVLVKESATPQDTLRAFRKIESYYEELKRGGDFAEIAFHKSEDPSAKQNKGDLGYFSAFRMVYPFENAAYNTPVGQFSKPFRTQFGYHLIKTTDRRANQGDVSIAHVILFKDSSKTKKADNSEKRALINDIYKKYQEGESFESLARQFSEDKSTNQVGGEMSKFSSGQLSSIEFEKQAFSLTEIGQVSKPFETEIGFHFIKLLKKYPIEGIESLRNKIKDQVKKDDRSMLIETTLANKLKKKYKVEKSKAALKAITAVVTSEIFEGNWNKPKNFKTAKKVFVTIDGKEYSSDLFLDFLLKKQKRNNYSKNIDALLVQAREDFVDQELKLYYDSQLENEFEDFHFIMNEYRDGLLLFDLMEKEIWERAKTDSIGLESFYTNHLNDYKWLKRYDAVLFSSKDKKILKKALKLHKKGLEIDKIKNTLNIDNATALKVQKGVFESGYDALKNYNLFESGVSDFKKNDDGYYGVSVVNKVLPPATKTIEECKGKLTSDYQQYLEKQWVFNLKKEFNVKVNSTVFEKVKIELKQ